ncbi:MAG: DNA-3-methyladenine glycosylase I [Candidatus Thorarchaeota archaeon]
MSSKKISRCPWVGKYSPMIDYHDKEWGVPQHEDKILYEFLILEGAQAGLTWKTILDRREEYRKVFAGFDPLIVSKFSDDKIQSILDNSGIIKNRLKVKSAITNAQILIKIQNEFGSFNNFIWDIIGNNPIINNFTQLDQIPPSTELSKKMSKLLKKRGFSFVGPTICYAFMQAVGMVNDHLISCFRYNEINNISPEK